MLFKKNYFLFVFIFLIFEGCATTKYTPIKYTTAQKFFPAVYGSMKEILPNAQFSYKEFNRNSYFLDINKSSYLVSNIQIIDGLLNKKFDFKISIENETININIENPSMYNSEKRKWEKNEIFLFYDINKLKTKVAKRIKEISLDKNLYLTYKTESTQLYAPIKYSLNKDFFPAIYGFLKSEFPDKHFNSIIFYNKFYSFSEFFSTNPLNGNKKFIDIEIAIANGNIEVNIGDVGYIEISSEYATREKIQNVKIDRSILFYDIKKLRKIAQKINNISLNEDLYLKYKKEALSDVLFVSKIMQNLTRNELKRFIETYAQKEGLNVFFIHTVTKNLTNIGFDTFIQKYVEKKRIKIIGKISNIDKVNKTFKDKKYKYKVSLNINIGNQSMSSDYIYINYYTNKKEIVNLQKRDVLNVEGMIHKVSRYKDRGMGYGLSMELIE